MMLKTMLLLLCSGMSSTYFPRRFLGEPTGHWCCAAGVRNSRRFFFSATMRKHLAEHDAFAALVATAAGAAVSLAR
jgi:hypothetical protein